MLIIALVALIVFGPRKLPELGRSLGKSIGEFKRASEDFKRTWEREVEVERVERDLDIEQEVKAALSAPTAPLSALPYDGDNTAAAHSSVEQSASRATRDGQFAGGETAEAEQTIARTSSREARSQTVRPEAAEDEPSAPAGKQDWL